MNVLDIPKYLIYMPRKDLKKFGIGDEGTVGDQIYQCLRRVLTTPQSSSESYFFDEAWYVCTIVLHHWDPVTFLKEWREKETPPLPVLRILKMYSFTNIILGIVHAYLCSISLEGVTDKNLTYLLQKKITMAKEYIGNIIRKSDPFCIKMNLHLYNSSRPFLKLKIEGTIPPSAFDFTKPTDEIVYAAINWYKLTNHYDRAEVYFLITFIANNHEERMMLLDKVILGANRDRADQRIDDAVIENLKNLRTELSTHRAYYDEKERRKVLMMEKDAEIIGNKIESSLTQGQKPTSDSPSIPHMPLNGRSEAYGRELCRLLVLEGFLAADTDMDSWLYVMGFPVSQPKTIKPIEWLKNQQLARIMFKTVAGDMMKTTRISAKYSNIIEASFVHKNKKLNAKSWKNEPGLDDKPLMDIFRQISDL